MYQMQGLPRDCHWGLDRLWGTPVGQLESTTLETLQRVLRVASFMPDQGSPLPIMRLIRIEGRDTKLNTAGRRKAGREIDVAARANGRLVIGDVGWAPCSRSIKTRKKRVLALMAFSIHCGDGWMAIREASERGNEPCATVGSGIGRG